MSAVEVAGYCPMGCGQTLQLDGGGTVLCADGDCPNPLAVDTILGDPEREHIVELGDSVFTVQHPLRERVSDELLLCGLHQWLSDQAGPPAPPGRYRVLPSVRITSPWIFEPMELDR